MIRGALLRITTGIVGLALLTFLLASGGLIAAPDKAKDNAKDKAVAEKHDDHGHPEASAAGDHAHQPSGGHHEPSAMEHVLDDKHGGWHFFMTFWPTHLHLPKIGPFQITKFMVLQVIAAALVIAIYVPLARRLADGRPPRGAWQNTFEVLLTFVREEIAKPNIGEHDADRYVPFLWTMFLFVLFNNLLGMLPFMGSATASIYVTAGLAIVVFFAIHGSAIAKMGFGHYLGTLWPHIDVPFAIGIFIKPLVFVLEVIGVLVRNLVLAVRLFANMFAGHMVLATILIFIYTAAKAHPVLWGTVTVGSVLGMVALSLLELFVAFLQAYIFTFLTSLFMGMALHPAH